MPNRLEVLLSADASQFQSALQSARSGLKSFGLDTSAASGPTGTLTTSVTNLGASIGKTIIQEQLAAQATRDLAIAEIEAAQAADRRRKAEEKKANALLFVVEETDLVDNLAAARAKAAQDAAREEAASKSNAAAHQESSQALGGLATKMAAIAAGAGLLTKGFLDASARMEQYRTTLQTISKSSEEADAQLQRMVKFAASTPFEMTGIVQAGVQLKSLGLDVDRVLPLAGDLASVFGKDITEGAHALGKAMAGSQDGIQQLADTFGITRQKMIQYGAATAGGGDISVRTAGDVAKLRGALEAIVKTDFGGAMAKQAETLNGKLSNLQDAITQLMTGIGDTMAPTVKVVVGGATAMVEHLNQMPTTLKGVVGFSVAAVPAIVGVAGAMRMVGAETKEAIIAAGPYLAVLAAVAAAAMAKVSIDKMERENMEANRQMADDLGKQYEKLGQANLDGWATANAEALHMQGVSTKDLIDAQQALADKIGRINADESLSADQKKALTDALVKQKDQLHQNAAALTEYERKLKSADDANENAAKFIEDVRKGYVGVMQAQTALAQEEIQTATLRLRNAELLGQATVDSQKAISQATVDAAKLERDAVLASVQEQMIARQGSMTPEDVLNFGRQREAAEKKYTNTVKDEAQKVLQAERDANQKRLEYTQQRVQHQIEAEERYLHQLERVRRYGTDTSEEEAASSKRRMLIEKEAEAARYSAAWKNAKTPEDQAAVNADHRAREAKIEDEHAQRLNSIEDRKSQRKADKARMSAESTQLELDNNDQEIQALERRREKGEAVEGALAAAYQKRHDLRIRLARENADASSATENDPDKQRLIEKKRQAEVSKADSEFSSAREKAHDDEMKRQADQYDAQVRNIKARIDGINQEIELAKRNGDSQQKINDLLDQRNKLVREKADAESKGASAKAGTSTETATEKATVEQENKNRRRQAEMDTNNGVANRSTGGARIAVDANGNRVLVPGTDESSTANSSSTAASGGGASTSSGGSATATGATPAGGGQSAGGGGTMTAGNITINAQSVTVNASSVSGSGSGGSGSGSGGSASTPSSNESGMQSAPRPTMATSYVGDFMGGLNSSAIDRDAFFSKGK